MLLSGDETEFALAGGLLSQLVEHSGEAASAELAALLAGGHADPLSAGSAMLTLLRVRAARTRSWLPWTTPSGVMTCRCGR